MGLLVHDTPRSAARKVTPRRFTAPFEIVDLLLERVLTKSVASDQEDPSATMRCHDINHERDG